MTTKKCENCGGSDLQWYVSTVGPRDVQDGRIRMSEVSPIAYLACEECSETIQIIQEDEINRMLNTCKKES
jgi:hypothetical protein